MAYTVDDAIAAVNSTQAAQPLGKSAYIRAHVSIKEDGGETIDGDGPLMIPYYQTALLGNLGWAAAPEFRFFVQRGANGPQFLLGLDIEPIFVLAGPIPLRLPSFLIPILQRLGLLRKHYGGHFRIDLQYQQPDFTIVLNENQLNPRLTGRIGSIALAGAIVPPANVEVVLESVATADVWQ
jgi:hypothetical protein